MNVINTLVSELAEHCSKGRLTFLVGAGINMGRRSHIPGWDAFIGELLRLLGREAKDEDIAYIERYRSQLLNEVILQIIDQTLKSSTGRDEAAEAVRTCVDSLEFSPIHRFLGWAMQEFDNGVLTTNYDQLIDCAATRRTQEGAPPLRENSLVRLHGSVTDPSSMRHTVDSVYAPLTHDIVKQAVPLLEGRILVVAGYKGADEFDVLPLIFEQHRPTDIIWVVHPTATNRDADPLVKQRVLKVGAREPVTEDIDRLFQRVYRTVAERHRYQETELEEPWSRTRGGNAPNWWKSHLADWANNLWHRHPDEMRFLWARVAEHVRAPFLEKTYQGFLCGSPDTLRRLFAEAHLAYHLRTRRKLALERFQTALAEIRRSLGTAQEPDQPRGFEELLTWTLHEYGVALQNVGRHTEAKLVLEEATRQRVILGDLQASYSMFQMFMNGWVAHDQRGLCMDDFAPPGWRTWLSEELQRYVDCYRAANTAEHHGTTIHNRAFVHQTIALEHEAMGRGVDAERAFSTAKAICLEAYNIRRRLRDPRMMAQSQVRISQCTVGLARAACRRGDKDQVRIHVSEAERLVREAREIYGTVPQEDIRTEDLKELELGISRLRRDCLEKTSEE